MRKRFFRSAIQHIYLRCIDKGVIFYTVSDRLVYYTLASVKSQRRNVRVLAAAIMFTHVHQSVMSDSYPALYGYLHDLDTSFSRLYNAYHHRSGRLFGKPPGCSQKYSLKEKRTNLIYVYNNHVEKGLCRRAVDERWSLLAYAFSDHPFSPAIQKKTVSRPLRRALNLVDRRVAKCRALEYCDLDGIFARLTPVESQQFVDYVISRYRLVDFAQAAACFDSLEKMVVAADSTTGGEYDINEDFSREGDSGYVALIRDAASAGYLRDIFSMSEERIFNAVESALARSVATPNQVRKFFHLGDSPMPSEEYPE